MRSREDIYYQAVVSRDARFDGKFFTGVKSTGIYCRPICPAQPKRKNVEFFAHAFSAEKAGYRPCLRCRPECAPLSPAWLGKTSTVQRALRLIANNALLESNEDQFAAKLGVSARHLRRLFENELGKTPKQIHDSNRIGFARKLVSETSLSITDIVFTAGYTSIRRFNDAFKARFERPPSSFRKKTARFEKRSSHELTLSYRPPFDWQSLLEFYRTHQITGSEKVTHDYYQRVFRLNGSLGAIQVTHDEKNTRLILKVFASEPNSLYTICQKVRSMFDLDSDPVHVDNVFSSCELMSKLSAKHPGLRIPRGWDGYETAIAVILAQLVSVKQASSLISELVRNYGEKVTNPIDGSEAFLFPDPAVLANESLSKVKTTRARKETISEVSQLYLAKQIHFNSAQDTDAFVNLLLSIRGVGPWTAEVICLRSLGDPDAFPAGDLILKRVLKKYSDLDLKKFSPWRAYAAICLWQEYGSDSI